MFVFSLHGDVALERSGTGPRALAAGEFLEAGDVVRTGPDARVTLIFDDDSQITLTAGRSLTIEGSGGGDAAGGGRIRGRLKELWARITGKADEADYTAAYGTVGAVRGNNDIPLENWPLYPDEEEELAFDIASVEDDFTDSGAGHLMKALVYEEYEQFLSADAEYTVAAAELPAGIFLYDLLIDFYMKAEQYDKAAEYIELKEGLHE